MFSSKFHRYPLLAEVSRLFSSNPREMHHCIKQCACQQLRGRALRHCAMNMSLYFNNYPDKSAGKRRLPSVNDGARTQTLHLIIIKAADFAREPGEKTKTTKYTARPAATTNRTVL
jgi:hypothetical protein